MIFVQSPAVCFFGQKLGNWGLALHRPSHWSSKNPEDGGPAGPQARSPKSSKEACPTASRWRQWLLAPHRNLQSLVIEYEKKPGKNQGWCQLKTLIYPDHLLKLLVVNLGRDRGKKFAQQCPAASRNTRTKDGTRTIKRLIQLQSVNTSHSYGAQFFCRPHHFYIYLLPTLYIWRIFEWINNNKHE